MIKPVKINKKVYEFLERPEKEDPMEITKFWVGAEPLKLEKTFGHSFWAEKGWELTEKGDLEQAIYFYLQGLNEDDTNFYVMVNLGWLYDRLNMLKTALFYFTKAYLRNLTSPIPVFGIAVALNKIGRTKNSLEFAKQWELMTIEDKIMKSNLIFLIAINNKELEYFEEAAKRYQEFLKLTEVQRK
jgi:tetratricopeptide (TPR) repeat protein